MLVLVIISFLVIVGMPQAQVQPVFRIAVLDEEDGPLTRGAQLAVQEINSSGGVIGADGTAFQLQLVIQSPEDMDFALSNIAQADVIAIIGPSDSLTALGYRDELRNLAVPILTTATDDTLLASDSSELFMRIRAAEQWMGLALADY
jgi:ABC-type branched-subunit amino acid transport system substrate-binding protein